MSEKINKKINKGFSEIGKGVIAITLLICGAIALGEVFGGDLQEINTEAQTIDLTNQEDQTNLKELQKQIEELQKELEAKKK